MLQSWIFRICKLNENVHYQNYQTAEMSPCESERLHVLLEHEMVKFVFIAIHCGKSFLFSNDLGIGKLSRHPVQKIREKNHQEFSVP